MKKALIVFLALITSFVILFSINTLPVSSNSIIKTFVINQGDGLFTIATRLQENNFIRNRYIFTFYSYFFGLNTKLQAGTFRLSSSLSVGDIITKLSKGGSHDYWLRIIDGSRLEELSVVFPKSQEGYIYPDSYLIPQEYTVAQILEIINKNFTKNFQQSKQNATNQRLDNRQIVILASLLEREAKTLESKQIIAGILLNRFAANMPLQVDASVQYARDSLHHPKNYWLPLDKKDLSIVSPFNTYKNADLPPSPICNPGYDSLFAAFHPLKTDFLYYLTGANGQMYYARTLAEHNTNIAKYLKSTINE